MYRRMVLSAVLLGVLLMTQCQGQRLDKVAAGEAATSTEQLAGPVFVVVADPQDDAIPAPVSGASLPVVWHN